MRDARVTANASLVTALEILFSTTRQLPHAVAVDDFDPAQAKAWVIRCLHHLRPEFRDAGDQRNDRLGVRLRTEQTTAFVHRGGIAPDDNRLVRAERDQRALGGEGREREQDNEREREFHRLCLC